MYYKEPNQLGHYLAGLWEGDGNIAVKNPKYPKPTVVITFHKSQAPLAEALRNTISKMCDDLNSCSLFFHSSRNACYFSIHSTFALAAKARVQGMSLFVILVNGRLRTPKAYQIAWVIDWLNSKCEHKIPILPICNNTILGDAWLAGFIDADASFAVRQTGKRAGVKKLVECQMTLVQRARYKKTNESVLPLFQKIAQALKTNIGVVPGKTSTIGEQYKIKVTSIRSKAILRRYLAQYPLLTSKYLDYQNWCHVDDLMIAKQHYTTAGWIRITALKGAMNRSRTLFIWDHLDRFL